MITKSTRIHSPSRVSPFSHSPIFAFLLFLSLFLSSSLSAQLIINEGSNRNFNSLVDEYGDAEDWIELYNSGSESIDLFGYSLTDDLDEPTLYTFPHFNINPGEFLLIFCSGKNTFQTQGFTNVAYITDYTPSIGWNEHAFDQEFVWDGFSDIVVNSCSYNSAGYTVNSIFNQTETPYVSTTVTYADGNDSPCYATIGEQHYVRPNIQLNGIPIGEGTVTNGNTGYPAPYGNWYFAARNQMLYTAEELTAAGLTAGPITSLAWDVVASEGDFYSYINISIKQIDLETLTAEFLNDAGSYFHTNFKLEGNGETVRLFSPEGIATDSLDVDCPSFEASLGCFPDGSEETFVLQNPTPGYSNETSTVCTGVAVAPAFSVESGIYASLQYLTLYDLNTTPATIYYTTNGQEPNESSTLYNGEVIPIFQSAAIRAKAYVPGLLPSEITTKSILINVDHTTPIVSVVVDPAHLYGESGIFDNWGTDWERFAQIAYFDSSSTHPLLFERSTSMQVDGGWGGSRYHPQHSFRLELAKGALGESPVELPLLPNRPEREIYSKLYFRNGSNMWLAYPWKDAMHVEMMMGETNGYFSAMRPAVVYINGNYFGVYEMREKLDREYFETYDNCVGSPMDNLTQSAWYGGQLRANEGDIMNYYDSFNSFSALDPSSSDFLEEADDIYDMEYLTDYIIGEAWVGNTDWPGNNIRIYRSDSTFNRWRFVTIDLELALQPFGWSECAFNGLNYAIGHGEGHIYVGPWVKSLQNDEYKEYFINRYADVLNTSYRPERLLAMSQNYFERWALEMPQEFQVWVNNWEAPTYMSNLYNALLIHQDELVCKSENAFDNIQESFGLDGTFNLTLEALPAGAGKIHINSITPTDLPWDGMYFDNIPVTITAEANEGYVFDHWVPNAVITDINNPNFQGAISANNINFTAVFNGLVGVEEVTADAVTTELSVYPNPASNVIQMENSGKRIVRWEMYTTAGQLIKSSSSNMSSHRAVVDLNDVAPGAYLFKAIYLDGSTDVKNWMKL